MLKTNVLAGLCLAAVWLSGYAYVKFGPGKPMEQRPGVTETVAFSEGYMAGLKLGFRAAAWNLAGTNVFAVGAMTAAQYDLDLSEFTNRQARLRVP